MTAALEPTRAQAIAVREEVGRMRRRSGSDICHFGLLTNVMFGVAGESRLGEGRGAVLVSRACGIGGHCRAVPSPPLLYGLGTRWTGVRGHGGVG